jgi:hypothetical protein
MALTSRSDTQETSHIFMWDEWTFTLKVATFDGAFLCQMMLKSIKIFVGNFAIFFTTRVLTVYEMDILMTIFISIIVQYEDICVRVQFFPCIHR